MDLEKHTEEHDRILAKQQEILKYQDAVSKVDVLVSQVEELKKANERMHVVNRWVGGLCVTFLGIFFAYIYNTFQTKEAAYEFKRSMLIEIQDRKNYSDRIEEKVYDIFGRLGVLEGKSNRDE